jgi:2',3'-cyclic-nucleotide 2'-phosphodiesterase (5'-nucleotidase family)
MMSSSNYLVKKWTVGLVLILVLVSCSVNHFASYERITNEVGDILPDSAMTAFITPFKEVLDAEMNEIIGQLPEKISMGRPESTLGNWFADIQQRQTEQILKRPVAFSTTNSGGMRIPEIAAGPIRKGTIYELMPFDNQLVAMDMEGTLVQVLLDHIAAGGGWPISSSVRFEINAEEKATQITINGQPLDPNAIYTVGLSDYIANGGSGCDFLVGRPYEAPGVLIREAIINFLKAGGEVPIGKDGRISKINP